VFQLTAKDRFRYAKLVLPMRGFSEVGPAGSPKNASA
jgi:hypothetical protein